MSNEIKVGDTVDCSRSKFEEHSIVGGIVEEGPDKEGDYFVIGKWSNGDVGHVVEEYQITRHVPAAPVVERPKSCGDKPASEMTVRERFVYDFLLRKCTQEFGTVEKDIEDAETTLGLLIAALDKERAK